MILPTAAVLSLFSSVLLSTEAFSLQAFSRPSSRLFKTELYRSIAFDIKPSRDDYWTETDPQENIQSYLEEPEGYGFPREHLTGTALVSGLVKDLDDGEDRMDMLLFDAINSPESRFQFEKIVAFVDDVAYAKKIMISRKSRYSGLLDVLDFTQASAPGALPTKEQLEGVSTWVAYVESDHLDALSQIIEYKNTIGTLHNVGVLLVSANGIDYKAIEETMSKLNDGPASGLTVLTMGKPVESREKQFTYEFAKASMENGTLEEGQEFSRTYGYRLIADMLSSSLSNSTAFAVREIPAEFEFNSTSAILIKGLRAAGYDRLQEMEHMINNGVENYLNAIDEYKNRPVVRGEKRETTSWDDRQKKQAEDEARRKNKERNRKTVEIAKQWAKREFYREDLLGRTTLTEEEYMIKVWDQAMEEAKTLYVEMFGEDGTKDPNFIKYF